MRVNIEIFPAEKACEQGCSTCPMARRDKAITATTIHPEVQHSFSLFEKILAKKQLTYDLHFTSALNLFPKINHPYLMHMSRVETSTEVRVNDNAELFAQHLNEVLRGRNINPKVIGISIVPKHPLISGVDMDIAHRLIAGVKAWHFSQKRKSIELTIRSNLIPMRQYHEIRPLLIQNDELHIPKLMQTFGLSAEQTIDNPLSKTRLKDGHIYFSEYVGKNKRQIISVKNRVIAQSWSRFTQKILREQAMWDSATLTHIPGIAFAPRGIMLLHSSLTVNNPMHWISHSDFRYELMEAVKKEGFSMPKFLSGLMNDNILMHNIFIDHAVEEQPNEIPLHVYPKIYKMWRPEIKVMQKKHLKEKQNPSM